MKTLKKVFAVGLVAAFASAGFAVQAGADHTEPRFTLEIDPDEGPVGQNIEAQVPLNEVEEVCLSPNELLAELQTVIANAIAGNTPEPGSIEAILQATLAGILAGEILTPEDFDNFAFLFLLLFLDPVTQEPVSEPGTDFWDPATGQGSIIAPGTDENPDSPNFGQELERPATYLVGAVCLGFKEISPETLQAILEAIVAELELTLEQVGACAQETPPFSSEACGEIISALLGALVEAAVDDDPDVAWVAPFCLLGDNFENCDIEEVVTPAEPVPAEVTFAG